MKRIILISAFILIGLFFGMIFTLTYLESTDGDSVRDLRSEPVAQQEITTNIEMVKENMHGAIPVDLQLPIPSVRIEALADTKSGYNIRIVTTNYTFTPEKVGQANVPNTGHAHLYVNQEKVARVYGEWFHIPGTMLSDGVNTIEVTLNANDHSDWLYNDEHISATISINK